MKHNAPTVTKVSRETRTNLWWALFMIENRLGLMTGRPTCTTVHLCSAPFPLPFENTELQQSTASQFLNDSASRDKLLNDVMACSEVLPLASTKVIAEYDKAESRQWLRRLPATPQLYFLFSCDLTVLMQDLLDNVYGLNSVHQSWVHIVGRFEEIKSRLDAWYRSLPPSLNFTHPIKEDEEIGVKTLLAFQYHSARVTLGRPCLCKPEKLSGAAKERKFCHELAVSAIESARNIAQMIPGPPDELQIFKSGPWWCLLHYVMQTATVLLLEISFGCIHTQENSNNLQLLARRCVMWLYRNSQHSFASYRAWQLSDSCLRRLALSKGFDVGDMPSSRSRPVYGIGSSFEPPGPERSSDPLPGMSRHRFNVAHTSRTDEHVETRLSTSTFIHPSGDNAFLPLTAAEYGVGSGPLLDHPNDDCVMGAFFREFGNDDFQ